MNTSDCANPPFASRRIPIFSLPGPIEGIVKVTGEVGSGKTMLCRMLLERLPENVETLYLANPSLSRQEILGAIADELGVPTDGKATHSLTRALQDALIERYAAGKRVVVLIDEAHAMPAESLEEIRLLSNLESKANKLLQIALFAQPELDERLAANDMRQLRERITQHFSLTPLKPPDVANYIEFRLRAAGYHGPNPFSEQAVKLIAEISEGLSRRINILADKALLAAYSNGSHRVDSAEIRTAAQDARFLTADARETGTLMDGCIALTVTSPPFLDVVDYSGDNWLRCWFTGLDAEAIGRSISTPRTLEGWSETMAAVFAELHRLTKRGGFVAFEVGEIRRGKLRLDEVVLPLGLRAGFRAHGVLVNRQTFTKTAHIWGVGNNDKGTNSNRVVLFEQT